VKLGKGSTNVMGAMYKGFIVSAVLAIPLIYVVISYALGGMGTEIGGAVAGSRGKTQSGNGRNANEFLHRESPSHSNCMTQASGIGPLSARANSRLLTSFAGNNADAAAHGCHLLGSCYDRRMTERRLFQGPTAQFPRSSPAPSSNSSLTSIALPACRASASAVPARRSKWVASSSALA